MPKHSVALDVVETPSKQAAIMAPEKLPAFVGDEDEELLCGSCSAVLVDGVSRDTFSRRSAAPTELLILCPNCRTHNRLPAIVGH